MTFLWPHMHPRLSEACVFACNWFFFFFLKFCLNKCGCPVLTPSRLLPSGVSAGGWASAAAGLPPQGSSETHRHAAAAIQSPAGEEAVCPDERSSGLHPGIVQRSSPSLLSSPSTLHQSFPYVWVLTIEFVRFLILFCLILCLYQAKGSVYCNWKWITAHCPLCSM